jgi:hypothetical protein
VLTVNPDGTMSPLIVGLTFATAMEFDGDTLYIANAGIMPAGQIIKVENFSEVELPVAPATPVPTAPAPQPTPTSGTGVVAPDTGSGGYADGDGASAWLLVLLIGAAGIVTATGAVALRRR